MKKRKGFLWNRDWMRGEQVILSAKEKKGLLIFFAIVLLLFLGKIISGKIISMCGPDPDRPQLMPTPVAVAEEGDVLYAEISDLEIERDGAFWWHCNFVRYDYLG